MIVNLFTIELLVGNVGSDGYTVATAELSCVNWLSVFIFALLMSLLL